MGSSQAYSALRRAAQCCTGDAGGDFEIGDCFFRWGNEQQELLCCKVSQILFPCRCCLLIKTYGKTCKLQHSCSYVRGREGVGRGGSRSKQEIPVSCSVVV